jgi:hypothetical protein
MRVVGVGARAVAQPATVHVPSLEHVDVAFTEDGGFVLTVRS